MKKYYEVSFRYYQTTTHCTNIVHTDHPEKIAARYSDKGHAWVGEPKEIAEYAVEEAKRRGMPIIEM